MNYLISFLEGIGSFISPCLLPMIPAYLAYFASGTADDQTSARRGILEAIGFVVGFTIVFVTLGAFAGALGGVLVTHRRVLEIVSGILMAVLGLGHAGIIRLGFLEKSHGISERPESSSILAATLFGAVFAVSWTPCVGVFLGSALLLAASSASAVTGITMLLAYSLGLGIPFVLSAVMASQIKAAIPALSKHWETINRACGIFLVLIGLLVASGLMSTLLNSLSVG
ncbi:MAG: cytochrome c biogenesis protein CcdA [Atopobiaceae bacterium]|nr:cytochrome c biogenesis protein CcdA [Atopobiaceae bacterium]